MRLAYCLVFSVISFFLSDVYAFNNLASRDLTDACAQVDAELVVPDLLGILTAVGVIDSCLCISTLPSFIQTNVVAVLAVTIAGQAETLSALTALVNGAPGSSQCTYPDHTVPSCQSANPCFFTCADGFTASPATSFPTSCVCSSPNTVCNGICGAFTSCPSGLSRRDVNSWDTNCRAGLTVCPVPGRGRSAWECVDTTSDLESCGGCIYPDANGLIGVDCTAIEGVSDVACHDGQCVVHRCMPGYKMDTYDSLCVSDEHSILDDASDILAAEFGLEHVPF